MEWLKAILAKTELTGEQMQDAIQKELPKHFMPKDKYNEVITERDNFKTQLTDTNGQLDKIKKEAGDNEALKKQIEDFKTEAKAKDEKYQAELTQVKTDNLLERELITAGAKNIKAAKALLDMSKVKLDGETLIGLKEQIEAQKTAEDSKFLYNEVSAGAGQGQDGKGQNGQQGNQGTGGQGNFKGFVPGENNGQGQQTKSTGLFGGLEAYYSKQNN